MKYLTIIGILLLAFGTGCTNETQRANPKVLDKDALRIAATVVTRPQIETWCNAQAVVTGKVTQLKAGVMAMSMPPITQFKVTLENGRYLSGGRDTPTQIDFVYRGDKQPFDEGDDVIIWTEEDRFAQGMKADTKTIEAAAVILKQLAPGWWADATGNCAGPWSDMTNRFESPRTSSRLKMTVEQIPPTDLKEHQNPFGDGRFKITIINTGKKIHRIEPLRKKDGKILWEQSLVAVHQGKACTFPAPMPAGTQPVELKPGERITGEINALKIRDINWPNGGARVYLTFAVGQIRATQFFYYYSNLHDPMRNMSQKQN